LSKWGEDPKRMSDVLGDLGGSLGIGAAVGTGKVWAHWSEIVGGTIADHAEPTSLKEGVLRIRTDSPAWATELGYRGAQIARRANEVAGSEVVKEVRVWTGPGPIQKPSGNAGRTEQEVRRSDTEDARKASTDEPMEALGRARRAWARRRAGGGS
jgi:predicted nucleic acid-binding Zn ribbon protein